MTFRSGAIREPALPAGVRVLETLGQRLQMAVSRLEQAVDMIVVARPLRRIENCRSCPLYRLIEAMNRSLMPGSVSIVAWVISSRCRRRTRRPMLTRERLHALHFDVAGDLGHLTVAIEVDGHETAAEAAVRTRGVEDGHRAGH